MAPELKLTYFPAGGRAEAVRVALHVGGVKFDDERIDFPTFGALKPTGKLPFGSLPVLSVDGEIYAESGAQLRYAGKLSGLYPKCDKAALKVDMIVDAVEKVVIELFAAKTPEAQQKFITEVIPRYVGGIDKVYDRTKGPYLLGADMSIADIKLACVLSMINDGGPFAFCKDDALNQYPLVGAAMKAVLTHEKVKGWKAMHS